MMKLEEAIRIGEEICMTCANCAGRPINREEARSAAAALARLREALPKLIAASNKACTQLTYMYLGDLLKETLAHLDAAPKEGS